MLSVLAASEAANLLCRGLHRGRGRGLLFRAHGSLDSAATAATARVTTAAAIAAVAAAVATTVAAAVATIAVATRMAAAIAAVAAAVAAMTAVAAIAAVASAAAEDEGRSLVLTADQGDSDEREKHRETKNNNTIHPQSSKLLTGTVSGKYVFAV